MHVNESRIKFRLLTKEISLKCKLSAPTTISSVDIGASRPFYLWTDSKETSSESEPTTYILTVENWALKYYLLKGSFEKGMSSHYLFAYKPFSHAFLRLNSKRISKNLSVM